MTEPTKDAPGQIAQGFATYKQSRDPSAPRVASDKSIRMNGTVNITGRYFDVPLITEVPLTGLPVPNGSGHFPCAELWQGGCIPGVRLDDDFDIVYSFYPWGQYVLGPDTERLEFKVYDAIDESTEQFAEVADMIVASLQRGKKVLVHCQAGLNRSGTACAAALVKLGMPSDDALDLLRASRGTDQVVCNPTFAAWLADLA